MTTWDNALARVCAPAMAGIKAANLMAVDKRKYPDFREKLTVFFRRGIAFRVLCECEYRAQVLVYRPKVLEATLKESAVAAILSVFGYNPAAAVEDLLDRLSRRMACGEFPHEIGAFLGYPPEDIVGFLRDRREGVLFVGEWKVYANAARARRLFSRYAACRQAVANRLRSGRTLAEIFCAA